MEKTESPVVDASVENPTNAQPQPELPPQTEQPDPRGLDLLREGFRGLLQPRNLVGFLWLVPSIAILVLNFRGHIIGAGLNCGSHCRIDPYSTSQVEQIDRLDGTNRDVLGALQFVAKGLEVWFMYVAAGFIYRIALHLSAKDNRLPVGLLLVYAEFMDLLYLKDLAVKARDLAVERNCTARQTTTNQMTRPPILYVFIFAAASLCVVANLMGVATATLIIPGLQWIDINKDESLAFGEMLSAMSPQDDIIARCGEGQLADGVYSCTDNLYGASLDELVEAAVASERQFEGRQAVLLPPVSQEANMTFSANVSDSADIQWAANRQLLREFSADLANYYVATSSDTGSNNSYPDSHHFNQSLQAQLQRVGPTVGLAGSCWIYAGPNIFNISSDREVRCYEGATLFNGTTATKCIRWGSGWNENSTSASFTILDSVGQQYDMDVSIFTTAAARYLRNQTCLSDDSCNWDQLFADPPDPLFRNISSSQQTYEYSMPQYTNNSAIWCDNTAFLSFASYALNPSPVSNLLQLVQLGVLHDDPGSATDEESNSAAATISIHPTWTLAAWSVNATDGRVPGTRGSSTRLIDAFQRFTSTPEDESLRFNLIHSYTLMQAVSLIPYTTRTISTKGERNAQRQREADNPYTQGTLTSWATVQLWKFGIDSRTKTLGVVIFIIGMVVVLVTSLFWFESPKSPTSIIVTALTHPPPSQVETNTETGAPLTARLKYQVMQDQGRRPVSFAFNHFPVA